jgi:hypothetical protein
MVFHSHTVIMMNQGQYLLTAALFFWGCVGVLIIGLSASILMENTAVGIVALIIGLSGLVAAYFMARKGRDDYSAGPVRGHHKPSA